MKIVYEEKGIFWDFLLLILALIFNFFDENIYLVFFQTASIVTFLILRFRATPLSPFFFLAPSSAYFALGVSYLYLFPIDSTTRFFTAVALGFFAFSITLRLNYRVSLKDYTDRLLSSKFIIQIYCITIVLIILSNFLLHFSGLVKLGTALTLMIVPTLTAIILGCVATMATRSFQKSLLLIIPYGIYIFFFKLNEYDFSRLSILDLIIFISVAMFFSYRQTRIRLFSGSKIVGVMLLLPTFLGFYYISYLGSLKQFGGDLMIVNNAIEVMNASEGHHEPFMPFFNSFFIFLPDYFWFSEKPYNFNPSAWYISTVMNLDPETYPWGIGVTMFGAGYLYGGYFGIALIFSFTAMFFNWIVKLSVNPFWVGFLLYFSMRLPLAFFRMDEMFLFGSFFPTLVSIYTFKHFFQRRINKCFSISPTVGNL